MTKSFVRKGSPQVCPQLQYSTQGVVSEWQLFTEIAFWRSYATRLITPKVTCGSEPDPQGPCK
jgi:hypothetical protein